MRQVRQRCLRPGRGHDRRRRPPGLARLRPRDGGSRVGCQIGRRCLRSGDEDRRRGRWLDDRNGLRSSDDSGRFDHRCGRQHAWLGGDDHRGRRWRLDGSDGLGSSGGCGLWGCHVSLRHLRFHRDDGRGWRWRPDGDHGHHGLGSGDDCGPWGCLDGLRRLRLRRDDSRGWRSRLDGDHRLRSDDDSSLPRRVDRRRLRFRRDDSRGRRRRLDGHNGLRSNDDSLFRRQIGLGRLRSRGRNDRSRCRWRGNQNRLGHRWRFGLDALGSFFGLHAFETWPRAAGTGRKRQPRFGLGRFGRGFDGNLRCDGRSLNGLVVEGCLERGVGGDVEHFIREIDVDVFQSRCRFRGGKCRRLLLVSERRNRRLGNPDRLGETGDVEGARSE